jgi:hypothetical protein
MEFFFRGISLLSQPLVHTKESQRLGLAPFKSRNHKSLRIADFEPCALIEASQQETTLGGLPSPP